MGAGRGIGKLEAAGIRGQARIQAVRDGGRDLGADGRQQLVNDLGCGGGVAVQQHAVSIP